MLFNVIFYVKNPNISILFEFYELGVVSQVDEQLKTRLT